MQRWFGTLSAGGMKMWIKTRPSWKYLNARNRGETLKVFEQKKKKKIRDVNILVHGTGLGIKSSGKRVDHMRNHCSHPGLRQPGPQLE